MPPGTFRGRGPGLIKTSRDAGKMPGELAYALPVTPARLPLPLLALMGILSTMWGGLLSPAGASQDPVAAVELRVRAMPVWHEPDDRLDIEVEVINRSTEPVRNFRLVVGVEDRVTSRTALHESFTEPSDFQPSSFPQDIHGSLAPNQSRTVRIGARAEELDLLEESSDSGVYPLTITAQDRSTFELLGRLSVPLIFYPQKPEQTLKLALVAPLNEVATIDEGGEFVTAAQSGRPPLEAALAPEGWLTGMMEALGAARDSGLNVAVAPTPRLLEEVKALADGYQEAEGVSGNGSGTQAAARTLLSSLRVLLGRRGIQRVLVPYSWPDLPALTHAFGGEQIGLQIEVGRAALGRTLGRSFSRSWLLAPAGRLDAATAETLSFGGTRHLIASQDSFTDGSFDPESSGCPEPSASFTCPVSVATGAARMTGYLSDPDLQERLAEIAGPGHERLDLQRFFAETSQIREEAPGLSDRVVQTTLPSLWHPRPAVAQLLLTTLAQAPWLETVTLEEGLSLAENRRTKALVKRAERGVDEPAGNYWAGVRSAQDLTKQFASLSPPKGLLQRLQKAVLVAQSSSWWVKAGAQELSGESYIGGTTADIQNELAKIGFIGKDEIILISREAPIELVLSNETNYRVKLTIDLLSDRLVFERRRFTERVAPGTHSIEIDAVSESSGAFPLVARIFTPEGYSIADKRLTVRSTELNVIAVGITVGALLFLIVFYTVRALRPKREGEPAAAANS